MQAYVVCPFKTDTANLPLKMDVQLCFQLALTISIYFPISLPSILYNEMEKIPVSWWKMLLNFLLFYIIFPWFLVRKIFSFTCSLALFISSSSVICLFIYFALSLLGPVFASEVLYVFWIFILFWFYIYHKYFILRCLTFAGPPFPSIKGMHFDIWCWLFSFGKSAYEVKEIFFCSCFAERFSCLLFFLHS